MPKINNNPIMKGASGMLGGVVVYRQFRGMTIMSNRPKKAKVMTPHQQAIKSRFLLAVEFAKRQMADPVLKAKYKLGPGSEFASAYIAAVTDYLRRAKRNDEVVKEKVALSELAVIMDTDKIDAKADAGKVVNEIGPPPGLRDTDSVRRHTVTTAYPISTVILNGTSIDRCSQAAAKDLFPVSRVNARRRETFACCFNGTLRSRAPTHVHHSE
jgi:hypothetical protein